LSAYATTAFVAIAVTQGAAPPRDVDTARRVLEQLAAKSELVAVASSRTPSRTIVRFSQRHRGLPVIGGGATVVLASTTGVMRLKLELELDSPEPSLDVETAARAAESRSGIRFATSGARLAFLPMPRGPARLVYELAGVQNGSLRIGLVDAHHARMYLLTDPVQRFGRARVYPANPIDTPELVDVTLDLPSGSTELANARVQALTCVDRHDVRPTVFGELHVCHLEPRAEADSNGDFLIAPASPTEPEDPFAELSLFHHADSGLQRFAALGAPGLGSTQLHVVSNLMWPPGSLAGDGARGDDPAQPFEPLAGAFYHGGEPLFAGVNGLAGPALWFGQGPVTDYAYDGDVVVHELTHAVLAAWQPLVNSQHADEQGLIGSPSAINEALADYFAAAFAEDPEIGEYAAPNLAPGLEAYRNVANSARCPEDLSGEAHFDSALLSGALWSTRASLPLSDREPFDRAVVDAALSMPVGDLGFDEFGDVLVSAVESSTRGSASAGALKNELEQRGLVSCERVLAYAGTPIDSRDALRSDSAFVAPGRFDTPWTANGRPPLLDFAPGILQFRSELSGNEPLRVRFEALPGGSLGDDGTVPKGQAPEPLVLVRWDSAIRFDWGNEVEADAMVAALGRDGSYSVSFEVPAGTERAFVMIANAGDLSFRYRQVVLEQHAHEDRAGDGGCACSAPGNDGSRSAFAAVSWVFGLLLAFFSRRRSSALRAC
jgi:MYXO-CTERM domain-containing protein